MNIQNGIGREVSLRDFGIQTWHPNIGLRFHFPMLGTIAVTEMNGTPSGFWNQSFGTRACGQNTILKAPGLVGGIYAGGLEKKQTCLKPHTARKQLGIQWYNSSNSGSSSANNFSSSSDSQGFQGAGPVHHKFGGPIVDSPGDLDWSRLFPAKIMANLATKITQISTWVCLKIVYPIVPNGFADHYPYFKKCLAIIGNINPRFSGPNPYFSHILTPIESSPCVRPSSATAPHRSKIAMSSCSSARSR